MSHGSFAAIAGRIVAYAALLVITYLVCFPLIWALSTSLKPANADLNRLIW